MNALLATIWLSLQVVVSPTTALFCLLADDLKTIKPDVIISVPRVYERIFARVEDKLKKSSGFARFLFNWATEVGWRDFCKKNLLPQEHTWREFLDMLSAPYSYAKCPICC